MNKATKQSATAASASLREVPSVATWWRFPPLRNALVAGALGSLAWVLLVQGWIAPPVAHGLFLTAIALGGWHWIREALESLVRERQLGIEFLMLAAAAGSIVLGMWDEAVALVVLFAFAEGVEEYTHERTRASVRSLMKLVPAGAQLVQGDVEVPVLATTLKAGDRFRVRPGERVPTDGRIVDGKSSFNQAAITGESVPVSKDQGDEVFAGSINGEGLVLVEATRAFADNTVARIIHLVEQAQDEKGRAQQWIERFGRRYTPAVFVAAVAMVLVPMWFGQPVDFWVQRAIVLLVAAAPCALVMSTPVAMAAGIRRASRAGILVKGGVHLEHLASIRCVAFDKTGTLTAGLPQLTRFEVINGNKDVLLAIAAGLENNSRHPLAAAVLEAARAAALSPAVVTDFESMTGHGITGRIGEVRWYLASVNWFADRGLCSDRVSVDAAEFQANGQTVSLLGTDSGVAAILALADSPRPEAVVALQQLHALGFTTAMLSGDHQTTAETVARTLGIDTVLGALKPEQKVAAIRQLQRERGPVLMVGDGVNDSPALAAATCGAAMGVAGSDAAIDAADLALMADDLRKIPLALAIGKSVRRVSQQNIVLSIAVLVAMIPAAVMGLIGVTTAVIVHEAAELLAVANGLRAGRATAGSRSSNA